MKSNLIEDNKRTVMQRVATFDIVRGIAIFLVLFFHVFFFLFDSGLWESRMDGEDVPFLQLAVIFYFAGW
ncbi:MAG: heparan-alpha-glucosaminide N-acetyltransferase domain-containing protein, partial [Candidatus Kariarchaeaceae archaeon]